MKPDTLNTPIIWPTQLLKAASVLFIVGAVAWIYAAAWQVWGAA